MLAVYLIIFFGIGYLFNQNSHLFVSDSDSDFEDFSFINNSDSEFSDIDVNTDYSKINFSEVDQIKYFDKYTNKEELWYSNEDYDKFYNNILIEKENKKKTFQLLTNPKF